MVGMREAMMEEGGRDMGKLRDTYLLFLFSFNLEHFSVYLLFTLLDLILGNLF